MILFTCQDKRSLELINKSGRFINKKDYIEEHFTEISEFFVEKYEWFVEKTTNFIKKPKGVNFPIWCTSNPKVCMQPTNTEIIYILDVPQENIILFDGSKWDYVLNNKYIPINKDDSLKYKESLLSKGIKDESVIFTSKNSLYYLQEQQKIEESWNRVFDTSNSNEIYIQSNIWEIKKEWIVDTVRYGEEIPKQYY